MIRTPIVTITHAIRKGKGMMPSEVVEVVVVVVGGFDFTQVFPLTSNPVGHSVRHLDS